MSFTFNDHSPVQKIDSGIGSHSLPLSETFSRAIHSLEIISPSITDRIRDESINSRTGVFTHRVVENAPQYNAWGKGLSEESSKVSAIMEYIERLSIEAPENLFKITGAPLSRSMLNARSYCFDELFAYNFQHSLFDDLTNIDNIPIRWVLTKSLTRGDSVYVPATRVFTNVPQKTILDASCTNGASANNTVEEAILQGLCELVERHTLHLHYLNKAKPKLYRIHKSMLDEGRVLEIIDRIEAEGWMVVLTLHDTGLPFYTTSAAMYHHEISDAFRSYRSLVHFATAPTVDESISRCISECMQTMAAERSHLKISQNKLSYTLGDYFLNELEMRLSADAAPNVKKNYHETFNDDIDFAVRQLENSGYEVLFFDCTDPRVNIPVVRVICPGLQPNFLLKNHSVDSPYAIVSPAIDNHQSIWKTAKNVRPNS